MKVLLAIDTSSGSTGVAVAQGGRVLAASAIEKPYRHAENLFEQIDAVLHEAGISKMDLTGIAVTQGPGSFTGLRVGLATAKGLAYGLNIPVAGVSSLKALAEPNFAENALVAPVFDARKGQLYAAAYNSKGHAEVGEKAWNPTEFVKAVKNEGGPVHLIGSGLGPYRTLFEEALGEFATFAAKEKWNIDPGAVARLGQIEFQAGRMVEPAHLEPVYLRRSEAEENASTRF